MVALSTPPFDGRHPREEAVELFQRHILPLRIELLGMALKMTSRKEDAEDLLHDSFLKALTSISSLADELNCRAWMYSILRNTFISNIRSASSLKVRTLPANSMDKVVDLVTHCNGTATKVEVWRALQRLEVAFRTPIILCDICGYTYAEAAEKIGCPLGTLMSRLARGRNKLRQILSGT